MRPLSTFPQATRQRSAPPTLTRTAGAIICSLCLLQNVFQNPLSANDQLRQRVAFGLSQMLVTSGLDVNLAHGMATYQQIFRDNAFGNYEDNLTKVTLSAVMSDYMNMVNIDKPANGVNPNENYARGGSFTFSDGNTASFAYTVNGVAQTKLITREVFRSPGTLCQ
jgi:uncharacterized protein (DUF1800 family)